MEQPTRLSDFRFAKTTLSNGLEVVVRRQGQLPIVAINIWYHVGSKNEERTQRGFTHLLEHLMFEGSEHYPGDFFKHLQRLGANINGSTSSDRTNYFVDLPAAHAERAIAIESDRMATLLGALDDSKLKVQKDVVKNEYRQNYPNRPYGRVWPLIAEALYPPHHPYSWMTIGVMEDIDRATLEDVSSYFRRFYVPGNASLAIVGDVDEKAAFAVAERYFDTIPGGTRAVSPRVHDAGLKESISMVLHDSVELDRLYLIWPTVRQFHSDDAALVLLGDVLARGRSSRLYRRLVIEEEIAQDVTAYQAGRELAGSFGIIVTLRPSRSLGETRGLVDAELSALAATGVEPDELLRVRNQRVAGFFFALEHMGGFGGVADRLNAYNVYRGDPSLITTDVERFQSASADLVRSTLKTYLAERPRVDLSVIGRKKAMVATPLDRSVVPASEAPVSYRPPAPVISTLSCGIPLWVFPRGDLPTVAGSIVVAGGAGLELPSQAGLTQLTSAMLEEGTTTRTAAQIALAAESMGATVAAGCGWDGLYVSFKCLSWDLTASLELVVDMLLNPTFPELEWGRVRGQALAALRAERDHAEARAHRALLSALYGPDDPYRFPLAGTEESVASITQRALSAFHARLLAGGPVTIVVAGDVDPSALADELEEQLKSWIGSAGELRANPATDRPMGPRLLLLDRPAAPQAVVRAGHIGIARRDPAYEGLLIWNQILGGQFTSRLNAKLREERGITYGVRSSLDCRRRAGPFTISSAVQTNRLGEALDEIHQELKILVEARPPSQVELDDARRALIEGQARQFETPSALVNRFGSLVVHGLPADHDATFAERLTAVDLDSLIATAHREIHPDRLVAVVVADAAQVLEDLKRLDWARVELVDG